MVVLDTRIAREDMGRTDWEEGAHEPAVIIGCWSLLMTRRKAVALETVVLATVSLRTFGVRYERDGAVPDDTIIAELREIARVARPIIKDGMGRFTIPVRAGEYRGEVAGFKDPQGGRHICAHIRDFS
jgi:hypothetical protein